MVKLNRSVALLESALEAIEVRIEELQEKMDAIEENACDHDRDMTESEHNRWLKLEDQIDDLQSEADAIENALDYLRDYTV